MAITKSRTQCAEEALRAAMMGGGEGESKLRLEDVYSLIDQAVSTLCDMIADSPRRYMLHIAPAAYALTAGIASLPSAVYAEYISDELGAIVTHPTYTKPLVRAPTLRRVFSSQTGTAGFYHVIGGNSDAGRLYAYSSAGVALTGSVTISGLVARQTFTTLAPELQERLIIVLANMAKNKVKAEMNPMEEPQDAAQSTA